MRVIDDLTDVSVKITGLNGVQVSGSLAMHFSDEMGERLGDIGATLGLLARRLLTHPRGEWPA